MRRTIKTMAMCAVIAVGMAGITGCGQTAQSSVQTSASAEEVKDQVFTENKIGTSDGYGYELWKDKGNTTFTVKKGGTFSCEWSDINNALFRRGQKFDCTKTYKELGNMSVEYGVDYQPDGNSYMCVYGWTRSPLIEFYIVDSWGTWKPPGGMAYGTVSIDGAVYEIYKTKRVNQPSIDGTSTFDQFWSVRKDKIPPVEGNKLEGSINISKHFEAWEQCGLEMGKMYEVALTIEGYQSNGKADVYKNELSIADTYTPSEDVEVIKL